MKKILLITSRSDTGGGPRHVLELANYLKSKDEKVFIASPDDTPYGNKFINEFEGHFFIPHRSFSFTHLILLINFIRKNKISLIHSHGKGAGIYSRALGIIGLPIIHTFHGLHFPHGLKGHLFILIEKILSFFTKTYICVSTSEKDRAQTLGLPKSKLQIRANGMDFDKFKPNDSKEKILGTLSRLDPHKNNTYLIDLMIHLPKEYSLKIAGDGEERADLENKIVALNLKERVTLLGEVSDPNEFLSQISIYVSASKGEGLPYAILEAIACKKPIVASNVIGHQDLLPEECLFEGRTFVDKILRAHAQDVDGLFEKTKVKCDLKRSLQAIIDLY